MADSQKYVATNVFDINNPNVLNGYIDSSGNYVPYATNGTLYVPITAGTSYTVSGIIRTSQSTVVRIATFTAIPSTQTPSVNLYTLNQGDSITITAGNNENYLLVMFCGDSDYTAYGSVQAALTANCANLHIDTYSWQHSLRKLTTTTEAVENPLYSDGTAITAYTIKGNTTTSGTPTPSNPVDVNGVGERTENLFDKDNATVIGSYIASETGVLTYSTTAKSVVIPCQANTTYTLSKTKGTRFTVGSYDSNPSNGDTATNWTADHAATSITITTTANSQYLVVFFYYTPSETETYEQVLATLMMNTGSTAKPYEPYGYKIPISSGGVTINIYISEPLQKLYTYSDDLQSDGTVIRNSSKVELTGNENIEYVSNYGQFKVQTSYYRRPPYDKTSYLCTHYKAISNAASWAGDNYITVSQSDTPDRFYRIKDSRYSTAEDFKTYLAQQYANGTPVTIYFVKAAATTETITAPSIPTTEGANSITVDTTVQPSEFTATWTGWHDSSVKEYAGGVGNNKFDEQYPDISDTIIYKPIYVGDGNFTLSTTAPQTSDPAALLFLLSGNVSSGASSSANGVWSGQNRTKAAVDGYVTVAYRAIRDYTPVGSQTMLNVGTTAMTYEPYEYGWV